MNRKGGVLDIIFFLIIIFVVFLFFGAFTFAFGEVTDNLLSIDIDNRTFDLNASSKATFGAINTAMPVLKWLALVVVVGMILAILISNFLVKAHPVFFIIYILITIVAVIFAVSLSNAYENIISDGGAIVPTLEGFTAMNYILLHLPAITVVVGILGAIMLFIGIIVDKEQGGSISI